MLKINIITSNNGVGLYNDYLIINELLKKKYDTHFIDTNKPLKRKADISIFLELVKPEHFSEFNILIPNPEWFEGQWKQYLRRFNVIMCKTRDSLKIYKSHSDKCIYTSFTSLDCYKPEIKKERIFFHNRGKSSMKGTVALLKAWTSAYGTLIINSSVNLPGRADVLINTRRLTYDDLKILMNSCYFHVCTSEYEGFGHYINEARSCGAVVITTNAPPMKEFIDDNGYLVGVNRTGRHMMGTLQYVDYVKLRMALSECCELGDKEITAMSERSRELYLQNDKFFKKTFLSLL